MRKFLVCFILILVQAFLYAEDTKYADQWDGYNQNEKYALLMGILTTTLFVGQSYEHAKNNNLDTLNKIDEYYVELLGRLKKYTDNDFDAMIKFFDYFYFVTENKNKPYLLAIVSYLDQNNIH